jgi:hypothetical protein
MIRMIDDTALEENPLALPSTETCAALAAGRAVLGIQQQSSPEITTLESTTPETIEAEISRLTWSVIDGRASQAERFRLADLVSAQHERRRA